MNNIRKGMVWCGMFLGLTFGAAAQSPELVYAESSASDSLVHMAFTVKNKKDVTSAISVLNSTEYLDKSYSTYPLEGASAFVGGNNLWNIGSNTLVLVDGVSRAIADVTTSEIEQITYLKGVNALALCGSHAADGVILITTKRGKIGEKQINVRVNAGIDVPISYPKYLGSAEFMTYYNQACSNDGLSALYDDATIANYASHSNIYRYPDVDYFSSDYLRKYYNTYTANADFSSGTERARFYAHTGLEENNSLLNFGEGKKEHTSRLSMRGNIDLQLNNHISAYIDASVISNEQHLARGDYWGSSSTILPHRFAPLVPIDDLQSSDETSQTYVSESAHIIDGKYLLGGSQQYLTTPFGDVYAAGDSTYISRQLQFTTGLKFDLKDLLKGLTFQSQMAVDYKNHYSEYVSHEYAVYSPTWATNTDGNDYIESLTKYDKDTNNGEQYLKKTYNYSTIDINMHFDYAYTFNEKHNVSAMLLASGTRIRQTGDYQNETNANLGLELGYNYSHRYYADFSGALVNSTKLAANKRVAFSPTISLGWVLSDESFLKEVKSINRLKLTASVGILNTDLYLSDYYLYDALYSSNAYFSWQDGTYTNMSTSILRGANKNLTYTKRKEINFGIEGAFFNRQLDTKVSIFYTEKSGIPVQCSTLYPNYFYSSYPATSYIPYTNYNANTYHGLDFQVNWHKNVGEVALTLGFAGTYATSKAKKRDEMYVDKYRNRVGKVTDAIFGMQSLGFFTNQNDIDVSPTQKFGDVSPGDIKYKDQNGDNIIDENDEVQIGRWTAPLNCGINITAQWRNFTLFVLGTGSFGAQGVRSSTYDWIYGSRKYSKVVRDSWTEATASTAKYPRLTTLSSNNNFRYSNFWTYSTDQINITKIQLTYSLPKNLLKNSFVKGLNLYALGSNLFMMAKHRDIMQLNVGSTPQTRFYNIGLKAEF
jgi:TonB-linked SusC/RagA family outer membrane protein